MKRKRKKKSIKDIMLDIDIFFERFMPAYIVYILFVIMLIIPYHFSLDIPQTTQIADRPWSLPEKIVIGVSITPMVLFVLFCITYYLREIYGKIIARKYTKGIQISVQKIGKTSTGDKCWYCHIKSDKIDTDCRIEFYENSETVISVIFPKEWIEKNQRIYKYRYPISHIIKNEVGDMLEYDSLP
jgi:hypothetical protein